MGRTTSAPAPHDLGIADAVTFHGHVDERRKHEMLSRSWVHVMPSRKEGWGLAVIEAAQHGVPTVGYRSSRGLTDSIIDGVTGLLVDDAPALASAAADLLDDAEIRRGASARRPGRGRASSPGRRPAPGCARCSSAVGPRRTGLRAGRARRLSAGSPLC